MNTLTARPSLLKQANLSLIRKVIRTRNTATRAEIANETLISSTTVRSLLNEMMETGELEGIGYDASSGGRKAERYRFKPGRYHSAAFCISTDKIHALLVNVCGEIVDIKELDILNGDCLTPIITYLDELMSQKEIKSIGLGVPGIVEEGTFWRKNEQGALISSDIGDIISGKYKIPVIMENDLNATAIGFGRCYEHNYPAENSTNTNMVYLHFEKGCISAGIIAGGRIIRGNTNFAGELGLIPMDNDRYLDECMADPMNDIQYVNLMVHILSWICGILNPQYIVLGGSDLRKDCISAVSDGLLGHLSKNMLAEILYSSDVWNDYHKGMAFLTAGKMFDDIHFTKEQP